MSADGTSVTFARRGAMSEVHSEADISRVADPATLVSTRPRSGLRAWGGFAEPRHRWRLRGRVAACQGQACAVLAYSRSW